MELNTRESLELGRKLREIFGRWQAIREAATRREGVYVLDPAAIRSALAKKRAQDTLDHGG